MMLTCDFCSLNRKPRSQLRYDKYNSDIDVYTSMLSNPRLRRLVVLGLGFLSLSLGLFLVIYPAPDLSAEQDILSRIAELDERLKHSNALNDQRKAELKEISQDFTELLNLVKQHQDQYEDNNSALNQKLHQYEDKGLFAGNMSGRFDLTVPGLAAFLPNTLRSSRALQPAIKISRDRNHVSMVIGELNSTMYSF
ncbi:uncharacterized protein LOC111715893 [Eurytemora carolleeae]|uniref:uncharacterized protein LOC111715893 n=1 Tax=Eurytemora carolleeae TaxID=1294199 RepID=UPI000C758CF9|nr:uncharacterized protein LOC111715893 [Eurytemora carolleeae]|eukprot:XP_023347059.1 uncharacterized protein LOC111715893 [Eurytemora affinis]